MIDFIYNFNFQNHLLQFMSFQWEGIKKMSIHKKTAV